ncbi:hypothetical protein DFH11DRAFT_677414 [Phellopilus nigrolimitatus]|nr:hypothetical protein DFH11DRAFT_677414 [Phellopilus nigrolimitatus]
MTFLTAVTVGLESCLSRDVEDLQNLRDDQWDAFKSGLLSALRNIGLLPGARNVYGLRDGYVLCYWDSQSEQLHQSILFRLRKEDTLYKMFFHGVSVIHVYTLISLEKNQGPFRSSLVEASLVKTFKFAKAHDSALAIPERLSGPSTVSPQPGSMSHLNTLVL